MAISAKPTVKTEGRRPFAVVLGLMVIAFVSFWRGASMPILGSIIIPHSAATGIIADIVAVAGLAVALWARATLGGNWSTVAAIKEDHELIERGPYRFVRHPIYSGILLMILGTAIASGWLAAFAGLALLAVGFSIKARQEERLLARQFPDAYPAYAARVKALVPGVW
jgi:protein-S-isoprenylcysteine O-methyltransferase Ste14